MKEITSSLYKFEDLINGNYVYVDKTEYIWNMIKSYKGMYFMSRPRRFGKSLTLSTIEAIFEGKKELFKGLAIYDKPYDWKPYSVIRLDMSGFDIQSLKDFRESLQELILECGNKHGILLTPASPTIMFRRLISALTKNGQVVILVDEYDKPILDSLGKPFAKRILESLKSFYTVIKTYSGDERFVFITGVSKFCHVSLFSGMNNPTDLTMRSEYATMLGYTQKEFESYFAKNITDAAKKLGIPRREFLQEMKRTYDGYRFEADSESVYNPVSIAKFFEPAKPKFDYYWFETGTPSFLLNYCRKNNFDFEKILTEPIPDISFSAYEIDNISPLALMFQTGYLTFKDSFIKNRRTYYHMQFPNDEVAWAFEVYLLNSYTGVQTEDISSLASSIVDGIASGNADEVLDIMKTFFARIPYPIQVEYEKYYQSLFYAIFVLLNIDIEAEACTNSGRIDATAAAGDWRFIFEFKLNKTAEIALDQIEQKEYFQKYRRSGKRIMLVGANFDFEKRQISDWKAQEFKQPRSSRRKS